MLITPPALHSLKEDQVTCEWFQPDGLGILPQGEENLVGKALIAARRLNPEVPYQKIKILKRIPIGGGLGGGSSNAGTLLKHLVNIGLLAQDQAEKIAPGLGADVPFFLHPVPSWVTGVGEVRSPVGQAGEWLKPVHFLVVLPPAISETVQVFRAYREAGLAFSPPSALPERGFSKEWLRDQFLSAQNDLQPHACRLHPEIAEVLATLAKRPAMAVGMSGSGSTCYAAFPSKSEAENNFKDLSQFFRQRGCKGILASSQLEETT